MPADKGNKGQGAPTPTRPIRINPDLWDRFGTATKRQDTDRSEVLREFMAWYARDPGSKMPKRPEVEN